MVRFRLWAAAMLAILLAAPLAPASAQEIRYSWMDFSFMAQDIDRQGTLVPIAGQTVDVDGSDGSGVRFRGSFGTWKNLYLFIDYGSTDIDVDAVVTNAGGMFPASDEFDFTAIRGGLGWKYPVFNKTDMFLELSYDSVDYDFGSFAGEDFDMDQKDVGGAIGVRTLFGDDFELRVQGRYTSVGDAELTLGVFDSDVLYGVGFAWQVMRGLSIVGDYEAGEAGSYSVGFRLDLSED